MTLRVLSLGAGVQSTVLALRGARGEFGPQPDCAIFADTGAEPRAIYDHLDWLETQLPFPVHRVSAGDLYLDLTVGNERGERFAAIPFHTTRDDEAGMGRRQCTREYKVEPIVRKIRELLGVERGRRVPKGVIVEQWIGISTDEAQRMKDGPQAYIKNRWPLIEARINRGDCLAWFAREHPTRTLAKSACVFCPYMNNENWRRIKADPGAWAMALAVDKAIRAPGVVSRHLAGEAFLHRSRAPLAEADLGGAEGQLDLFNDECDGMCGV